jgi:DNA-binding transcriptional ArsR family regulator
MSAVLELRNQLVRRIDESERELERLRAALVAYDDAGATPSPRPPRARRPRPVADRPVQPPEPAKPTRARTASAKRKPSPKRRTRELEPGRLEQLLGESSDGLSVVALARHAKVSEATVRQRLTELERAGQVRGSGSRRTSLWRLRSDEERIAERAAELRAASGAGS